MTANGRYVLFASDATDLTTTDTNGAQDVFLFDRHTGTVTLVSRSTTGPTTAANDLSDPWALSRDGRIVLFRSYASDLATTDTNGTADAFVFDRVTGTVTLVSHSTAGPATAGNAASGPAALSANGRYVLFDSLASDLVATDTNGKQDVFLFDRATGHVTLVSRNTAGTVGNDTSYGVALSANGRYALFDSNASDLATTDSNGASDVFLFDRTAGTVTLVSRSTAGPTTTGNGDSTARPPTAAGQFAVFAKAFSADGRYVAFESNASDLTGTAGALFLFDRDTGGLVLVSRTKANPTPASDGLSLVWKLTSDGRSHLNRVPSLCRRCAHAGVFQRK
jgi:Tol biopolymer transport system component